jgi:hypothetical protein
MLPVESVEAAESVVSSQPVTEKLFHSILHEVTILRQVKPDKLDVVLRPDAHTQISLQLRVNNGQVEGHARCDRGDFSLLSAHWSELQHTFDQQGIRLQPLKDISAGMDSQGGAFSGFSHSRQQQQRGRQLEELVISEIPRVQTSAPKTAPVSLSKTGRSTLQTWA